MRRMWGGRGAGSGTPPNDSMLNLVDGRKAKRMSSLSITSAPPRPAPPGPAPPRSSSPLAPVKVSRCCHKGLRDKGHKSLKQDRVIILSAGLNLCLVTRTTMSLRLAVTITMMMMMMMMMIMMIMMKVTMYTNLML